jgi:NAD/NADP transhydrogenase beta subunit
MKEKGLNTLLVLTSLLGFLEWGGGHHVFLFQAETEIFAKLLTEPASVVHPFTVVPLLGQLLLIYTLFQTKPSRLLTMLGMASLALLLGFMFVVGVLGLNLKIIVSVIPFMIVTVFTIRNLRNKSV